MHYIETMAYARHETPWHGLGVPVDETLTPDEMLVKAGLDWTVSKRPIFLANGMQIDDHYALCRDTDDQFLSLVGSKYNPVQNRDALAFFERFVKAGHMQMETAGSLKDGKFTWGLARINQSFALGHDVVDGYLLLSQPHLFGYSLIIQFTPVRVVCWNTLSLALNYNLKQGRVGAFRMPHSQLFGDDMKKQAEETLGLAQKQMDEFAAAARFLAGTRISDAEVTSYFYEVLNKPMPGTEGLAANDDQNAPRIVAKLEDAYRSAPGQQLPSAKGTYWGALNAWTNVIDFQQGRSQDGRMASAWFGPNQALKKRALEVALQRAAA